MLQKKINMEITEPFFKLFTVAFTINYQKRRKYKDQADQFLVVSIFYLCTVALKLSYIFKKMHISLVLSCINTVTQKHNSGQSI